MPQILSTSDAPLVRTDFSNPAAWRDLLIAVRAESADGFLANISVIDDPAFQDADPAQLARQMEAPRHAALFVADAVTFAHPERPILCIDASQPHTCWTCRGQGCTLRPRVRGGA